MGSRARALSPRAERAVKEFSHPSFDRQCQACHQLVWERRHGVFLEILEHAEDIRSGGPLWQACYGLSCLYEQLGKEQKAEVVRLLERFLLLARHDRCYSSWLAGDVLGSHIHTRAAEKALVNAILRGRTRFGRAGAVHGLVHYALERPKRRPFVLETLRLVARQDRAASIRAFADRSVQAVNRATDVRGYPFEVETRGRQPRWLRSKAAQEGFLRTIMDIKRFAAKSRKQLGIK
jgi:hypothetical protein